MIEPGLLAAAESIHDGWYAGRRIDWAEFIDRLESHTGQDLGGDMLSPEIRAVQAHIRKYRRAE